MSIFLSDYSRHNGIDHCFFSNIQTEVFSRRPCESATSQSTENFDLNIWENYGELSPSEVLIFPKQGKTCVGVKIQYLLFIITLIQTFCLVLQSTVSHMILDRETSGWGGLKLSLLSPVPVMTLYHHADTTCWPVLVVEVQHLTSPWFCLHNPKQFLCHHGYSSSVITAHWSCVMYTVHNGP